MKVQDLWNGLLGRGVEPDWYIYVNQVGNLSFIDEDGKFRGWMDMRDGSIELIKE